MKIYIVISQLTSGSDHGFSAAFKNKKRAEEYINNKFKSDSDTWEGGRLECYHDGDWTGFVEIVEIDTAELKY